MSFVGRARSSFERGDTLRAVLTLIAGLRRTPGREDAYELLVEFVGDHIDSGGIEHEIVQVLAPHRQREKMLSSMVVGLRSRDQDRIADRLVLEAKKRGIKYVPPPAPPDPSEEMDEVDGEEVAKPGDDEVEVDVEEAEDASETAAIPDPARQPPAPSSPASEPAPLTDEPRTLSPEKFLEQRRQAAAERDAAVAAARRRRTLLVVGVALVAGLALIGVYVAGAASQQAERVKIETAIQAFDRYEPEALAAARDAASGDPESTELLAFAGALSGEPTEVRMDGWLTPWGLGASAISALAADDLESAIALATKLDRTAGSANLASLATQALVAERRGETEVARKTAARIVDRFPDFVPAREIAVRIAARQAEFDTLRAAITTLAQISPQHPYIGLATLPRPRDVLLGPVPKIKATLQQREAESFIVATTAYREAVAAAGQGDVDLLIDRARASIAADPGFVASRLVLGSGLAWKGEPKQAETEFRAAADMAGSTESRLLVQAVAPLALGGAGRPDLGAAFTTPYPKRPTVEDRFDERIGDSRPQPLRVSASNDLATRHAAAADALVARAWLISLRNSSLGAATYAGLEEQLGTRGRALRLWSGGSDSGSADESDALMVALHDLMASRFAALAPLVGPDSPAWLPPFVSELAFRRYAYCELEIPTLPHDDLGLAHRARFRGLALAAAGRQNRGNVVYSVLRDSLVDEETTSVSRMLEIADAALHQAELSVAQGWVERARKAAPNDPDVARICRLMALARNKPDDMERCGSLEHPLRSSVRGLQAAGLLQLALNRPTEAAADFEAALEMAPTNTCAAAGLGRALADAGGRSAKKALRTRADSTETAAVAAHLRRWLAVLEGVRDGEPEGLAALDEAARELGPMPELEVERAHYHAAREEWVRARELYEGALSGNVHPMLAAAHVGLARILVRDGDVEAAQPHLKRYLEREPQGASAAWARRHLK